MARKVVRPMSRQERLERQGRSGGGERGSGEGEKGSGGGGKGGERKWRQSHW